MTPWVKVIACLAFIAFHSEAYATPVVEWAPRALSVSLPPGGSKTVIVKFATSSDVPSLEFKPVPALQGHVFLTPSNVGPVRAGEVKELTLQVSLPQNTVAGTIVDGVIHALQGNRKGVVAQPLSVVITATQPSSSISEVKLYGEPGNPLTLSYRLEDGTLATFQSQKDDQDIPTRLTALALLSPLNQETSRSSMKSGARPRCRHLTG